MIENAALEQPRKQVRCKTFLFRPLADEMIAARSYILEDEFFNKIGFVIETNSKIAICRSCAHGVPPSEVYGHWKEHQEGRVEFSEDDVNNAVSHQLQISNLVISTDVQIPARGSPPIELLEVIKALECPVEECGLIACESVMRKHFTEMRKNSPIAGVDDPHQFCKAGDAQTVDAQCMYYRLRHRKYFVVTIPPPSPRPSDPLDKLVQGLLDVDGELKRIPDVSDSRDLTAFVARTGWVNIVKNCEIAALHGLIRPPGANDPLLPLTSATRAYCDSVNKVIASRKFSSALLCTIREEYTYVSIILSVSTIDSNDDYSYGKANTIPYKAVSDGSLAGYTLMVTGLVCMVLRSITNPVENFDITLHPDQLSAAKSLLDAIEAKESSLHDHLHRLLFALFSKVPTGTDEDTSRCCVLIIWVHRVGGGVDQDIGQGPGP